MQITRHATRIRLSAAFTALALSVATLPASAAPHTDAPHRPRHLPTTPTAADTIAFDSGDFLTTIVALQDGNLAMADSGFTHLLQAGYDTPSLRQQAFRFAAMNAGPDAQRRATALAATLPQDDLARLVRANDAILHNEWAKATALLTPANTPLLRLIAPAFSAWATLAQNHADTAVKTLQADSTGNPLAALYTLHAALISEHTPDAPRTEALFQSAQNQIHGGDLTLARTRAAWLATHGHATQAHQTIEDLIQATPSLTPAKARLQNLSTVTTPMPPRNGIALLILEIAGLLDDAQNQNLQNRNNEGHTPDHARRLMDSQITIALLRQALLLNPALTSAHLQLAVILERAGDHTAARAALPDPVPTDPLAPVVSVMQARLDAQSHNPAAAETELKRALAENPNDLDLLSTLGDVQAQLGQANTAIQTYTQALSLIPVMEQRRWPLLLARAAVYDQTHRWAHARADLEQALTFAPNQPILLNFLGYGEIDHGQNLQQATELLHRAVLAAPEDAEIRDSYGWALLLQGQTDRALTLLQSAAEKNPRDPEINYHLGVAYAQIGRIVEARDQWNQALADNPTPDDRRRIESSLAHPTQKPTP